jgi:hypothetical protein
MSAEESNNNFVQNKEYANMDDFMQSNDGHVEGKE